MNARRSSILLMGAALSLLALLMMLAAPLPVTHAQTPEPTSVPHIVAVDMGGQYVLIDYTVTAGDFFIGSVLTFMVLLQVLLLVVFAYRKRYQ